MLKLKRRSGESIVLRTSDGEEIVITIEDVRRTNVSVLVDAPKGVKILRAELTAEEEPLGHLWKGDR